MKKEEYFLDTSALFKRYIKEEGSSWVDGIFERNTPIFISALAKIELISNMQRLLSVDKVIDKGQLQKMWSLFLLDVASGRITVLDLEGQILEDAFNLLIEIYLTPIDAVQTATALSLGKGVTTISSDRKLNEVLKNFHQKVLDPTNSVG